MPRSNRNAPSRDHVAMESICTIGDLVSEVSVQPDRPLAPDSDTPATIRYTGGDQASNVAAWAGALGASHRLVCKRGTDTSSDLAAAELRRYGVAICGPVVTGRGGVVVSMRDQLSSRTMASDRGVSSLLDTTELDPSWIASCDVLHVSGYCLMAEPMAEAAVYAASHARRVTVDLASAHDIELLGAQTFISRLEALEPDLAFATEAERAAVPGFKTSWVIKHGARGATFPEGFYPAPVVAAIDSTGAGDALAAGYLVGGPELAIEVATQCVGLVGAMPSQRER